MTDAMPDPPTSAAGPASVDTDELHLSAFDLRFRSLDPLPGEPINLCSACLDPAKWSIWLHTPEWGPGDAGDTRVLCTPHAIERVLREVRRV